MKFLYLLFELYTKTKMSKKKKKKNIDLGIKFEK